MNKLSIKNIVTENKISKIQLIDRLVQKNIKGGTGCPPPSLHCNS